MYLVVAMVIVLLQIHTICLVAALVMIHFIMDPQCISRGHDLVNGVQYGSCNVLLAAVLSRYL